MGVEQHVVLLLHAAVVLVDRGVHRSLDDALGRPQPADDFVLPRVALEQPLPVLHGTFHGTFDGTFDGRSMDHSMDRSMEHSMEHSVEHSTISSSFFVML